LAGLALPRDREAGVALLAASLCLEEVYAALNAEGRVLGVAFITGHGRSLHIQREAVVVAFGGFGGTWRYWAYRAFFSRSHAFPRAVRGLEGFSVEAECRGRGLGAAMLSKMIEDARSERAEAMELNVGDNNPARRLYERFGFRQTRTGSTGIFAKRLGFKRFVYYELEL
jgi:GNAT superfamily N-acetyltransferase